MSEHPGFGHNSGDRPEDLDQYRDPGSDFRWKLDPKIHRLPDSVGAMERRAFEKAIQFQGDRLSRKRAIDNAVFAPRADLTDHEFRLFFYICHYAKMDLKDGGEPRCTLIRAGELAMLAGIADVDGSWRIFQSLERKGLIVALSFQVSGNKRAVYYTPVITEDERSGWNVRQRRQVTREQYDQLLEAIRTQKAERQRKSRLQRGANAASGRSDLDVTGQEPVTDVTSQEPVTGDVTGSEPVMSQAGDPGETLHFFDSSSLVGKGNGARPPELKRKSEQCSQDERKSPPTPRADAPQADEFRRDADAALAGSGWAMPPHLLDGLMRYADLHTQLGSRKPTRANLASQLEALVRGSPDLGPSLEIVAVSLIEATGDPDATKIGALFAYLESAALKRRAAHNAKSESADAGASAKWASDRRSQSAAISDWDKLAVFGFGQAFTGRDLRMVSEAVPGAAVETIRREAQKLGGEWCGPAGKNKSVNHMIEELVRRLNSPNASTEPPESEATIKVKTAAELQREREAKNR